MRGHPSIRYRPFGLAPGRTRVLHSIPITSFLLAMLASLVAAPNALFAQGYPLAAPPYEAAAPSEVFELAETVARIGNHHIVQGDLEGDANIILIPTLERIPPEQREAAEPQVKAQREKLVQQVLREAVEL